MNKFDVNLYLYICLSLHPSAFADGCEYVYVYVYACGCSESEKEKDCWFGGCSASWERRDHAKEFPSQWLLSYFESMD